MFEENPCRWNALEVFQVDRSATELQLIRDREKDARDLWKHNLQQIKLRNGEMRATEESHLNGFRKRLFNPVQRLQEEQFVHQFHSFASDEELLGAVKGLAQNATVERPPMLAGSALVSAIGPLLPAITPPRMEDDLPWPDPPGPLPIEREPLQDAILRDC